MYKRLLLLFVLFTLVSGLAAAEEPWWFTLERGKQHFRSGFYGDALIAFEAARRARIAHFTRLEREFIRYLSDPYVRRFGDTLEFIEWHVNDRNITEIAAVLAELYHRVPRASLNGSVRRALEELDRLKRYPEAEFWIGETFRAEGELSMALRHYERALADRDLLKTPGFDVEILYRITNIHRTRGEYPQMERRAREILEGTGPNGEPRDRLWTAGNMRAAMVRFLENEGVNGFLAMYRHDNMVTERTHRLLGFFYQSSNRIVAIEHLMFAFLIQNTVLINEIIHRDFDFIFTTLEALQAVVNTRPELVAFKEEVEYYRTIYYLATVLHATGRTRPSAQLWSFLAGSRDACIWGERARRSSVPVTGRP